MLKRIGRAFVTGAVLGLIGQILMVIVGKFVPADLVTPVAMIIFGVIAAVFILSGIFPKVAEWGGGRCGHLPRRLNDGGGLRCKDVR